MNRGEVVEVIWYYTDMTGSKRRPAVLVQITSTRHGIPGTEVLIDPAVERASGLNRTCVVSCLNVTTYEQDRILATIGFLSDATMRQIEDCLKGILVIR